MFFFNLDIDGGGGDGSGKIGKKNIRFQAINNILFYF